MESTVICTLMGIMSYKCSDMQLPNDRLISLQGLDVTEHGVRLLSQMINDILGVEVSAMLGANIAEEVSRDQFCEATIGYTAAIDNEI